MDKPQFSKTQDIVDAFDVAESGKYFDINHLKDKKVGFSIQRKYPKDLLYIPLVNRKGEADSVSLIYVIYFPPEEAAELNPSKVPLIIRVATHSRYRAHHFDYDFEDPESPTKESIERTKATPTPLSLDFYEDYFYNHHLESFLDRDSENLTGVELLDSVFNKHCDTAHSKRGKRIRFKIRLQANGTAFFSLLISLFTMILSGLFGRTLDESDNYFAYLQGYKKESLKKLSTSSLNVFGYKASRSVIILFCCLVAIAYATKYHFGLSSTYLNKIFSDSFQVSL